MTPRFVFEPREDVIAEIRRRGVHSKNPFGVIEAATREGATEDVDDTSPNMRPPATMNRDIVLKYFVTARCEVYGALMCHARWIAKSRYELRLWRRIPSEISIYHIDLILRYVVNFCRKNAAPSVEIKVVSDYDRKLLVPRLLKFGLERRDVSWWGNLTSPTADANRSRTASSSSSKGGAGARRPSPAASLLSLAGIPLPGVLAIGGGRGEEGEGEEEGEVEDEDEVTSRADNDAGLYALEFRKPQPASAEVSPDVALCENGHAMRVLPLELIDIHHSIRCDVCARYLCDLRENADEGDTDFHACEQCRYAICRRCTQSKFENTFGCLTDHLASRVLSMLGFPAIPDAHHLDRVCTKFRSWCQSVRQTTWEVRVAPMLFDVPILHEDRSVAFTYSERRVMEYGMNLHKLQNLRTITQASSKYALPYILDHPCRNTLRTLTAHVAYSDVFTICESLPKLTHLGLYFHPYSNWELEGHEFSPDMWKNLQVLQLRPDMPVEAHQELTFIHAIPWHVMSNLRKLVMHVTMPSFPDDVVLRKLDELYVHRVPEGDDSWARACCNISHFGVRVISARHRKLLLDKQILDGLECLYYDPHRQADRTDAVHRRWKREMRRSGVFVYVQMPKLYAGFYDHVEN